MTVGIYYHKKTLTNGERPVMIRFTAKRVSKYKEVFTVEEKFWDDEKKEVKKSHPLQKHLNERLNREFLKCQKNLLDALREGKDPVSSDVFEGESAEVRQIRNVKIKTLAEKYVKEKSKVLASATYIVYESAINSLISIVGDMRVSEVDKKTSLKIVEHGKEEGWANSTTKRIITMFNQILNHFEIEKKTINYLKKESVKKTSLKKEDIELFEMVDLPQDIRVSLDIFLVQYFLVGSRVSDVIMLKKESVQKERVEFIQRKTKKLISVARFDRLNSILDRYMDSVGDYVFPYANRFMGPKFVKLENNIEQGKWIAMRIITVTGKIRGHLRTVSDMYLDGKKISSHIARHTFTRHAEESGESLRKIQGFLGHSKLETTEIYAKEVKNSASSSVLSMYETKQATTSNENKSEIVKQLLSELPNDEVLKIMLERMK